jgi:iron(II)-dependent oxidoreductase
LPLFSRAEAGLTMRMEGRAMRSIEYGGIRLQYGHERQTCTVPHAGPKDLAAALQDARHYTLALFDIFAGAGYDRAENVPRLPSSIRRCGSWATRPGSPSGSCCARPAAASPAKPMATRCWRAATTGSTPNVAHRSRWTLDLPGPGALKTYCAEVLDRMLERLAREPDDDAALYPYRLALAHEDMHGEALLYTLQTLGVTVRSGLVQAGGPGRAPAPQGEIAFAGGSFLRGGEQSRGFVFDNERDAATCRVAPFAIDAGLVSNGATSTSCAPAATSGPQFWSEAGRAWLMAQERMAPRYWRRDGADGWQTVTLRARDAARSATAGAPCEPVRSAGLLPWAGRRLPTENEWEFAATAPSVSGQPAFAWGDCGNGRRRLPAVRRLRGGPLPRIFGALVRHAPDPARRLVRDAGALPFSAFPEFLHAGARRYLFRIPYLRVIGSSKQRRPCAGKKSAAVAHAFGPLPAQGRRGFAAI